MVDATRAAERPKLRRGSSVPDEAGDVLIARARLLARPMGAGPGDRSETQLLGFEAGGHRFALPAESVVTVVSAVKPTAIPGMPAWLVGVIGVRGRVVAVVSPDRFLGTRPGSDEPAGRSTAVVVADASAEIALLVDRLEPVESIPLAATRPLPTGSSEVVEGTSRGSIDGRLVLDPDGLIAAIRSALEPMTGRPSPPPDHRPIGPT